jgi:hypothetical protein
MVEKRQVSDNVDQLLSPSSQQLLSDSEEKRKPIPPEDIQAAMKKMGEWLEAADELPANGEMAALHFPDGKDEAVRVVEWGKYYVGVRLQNNDGTESRSNIATGAFVNLTQEPQAPSNGQATSS